MDAGKIMSYIVKNAVLRKQGCFFAVFFGIYVNMYDKK